MLAVYKKRVKNSCCYLYLPASLVNFFELSNGLAIYRAMRKMGRALHFAIGNHPKRGKQSCGRIMPKEVSSEVPHWHHTLCKWFPTLLTMNV